MSMLELFSSQEITVTHFSAVCFISFVCLCRVFTQIQRYFSYLMATVLKSMFPKPFLTSSQPVHYPDTGGPVVVLFP